MRKTIGKFMAQRAFTPLRMFVFAAIVSSNILLFLLLPQDIARTLFLIFVGGVALGAVVMAAQDFLMNGVPVVSYASFVIYRRFLDWSGAALQRRSWVAFSLTMIAVAYAISSAYYFHPKRSAILPNTSLLDAVDYMFMAGILLYLAMIVFPAGAPQFAQPIRRRIKPERLLWYHWLIIALAAFGLAVLAEINSETLVYETLFVDHQPIYDASMGEQFGLLSASAILLVIGLGGVRLHNVPKVDLKVWPWWEIAGVVLLTGIGFGIRVWESGETIRLFVDEVNFSNAVQRYLYWETPDRLLHQIDGISPYSWIFPYWQGESVEVFGRNLAALRFPSAVVGALTIPALYWLGRTLFDRKTAFIAAALLITFPPQLHYSRLGLNQIADGLFGTLAIAFIARGIMKNRRIDYAIGGVMLGMTQYFFEGGRIFFIPLFVVWIIAGIIAWRPKPHLRGVLIVGLAATMLAVPIYYTWDAIGAEITGRMDASGRGWDYWVGLVEDGNYEEIRNRLQGPYLFLVHQRDGSVYYYGQEPLLMVYLVPFFLLGAAFTLYRFYTPAAIIPIWVISNAVGNSLLIVYDNSVRYLGVFPALMLMTAVGIRYVVPLLKLKRIEIPLFVIAVVMLVLAQGQYYFGAHLDDFNVRSRHRQMDGEDAILRSVGFPDGAHIHIVTEHIDELYTRHALQFLTFDLEYTRTHPDDFSRDFLGGLSRYQDQAFFLEPDDTESLALIEEFFEVLPPQYTDNQDMPQEKAFVLYYAPATKGLKRTSR